MSHRKILVVEDSPREQLLIKLAFEQIGIDNALQTVSDGDEAIAYLQGDGKFANRELYPFPTFLLTDLKMARVNGFELLLYLKRSQMIIVPTIVLTNSNDEDDIQEAYRLGANAYHVKPVDLNQLCGMLKLIYQYWTGCALPKADLPRKPPSGEGGRKLSDNLRHPIRHHKGDSTHGT